MEKLQLLAFKNIVEPLYNEKVSYIYFPIEWLEIVEIHYRTFLLTSKLKLVNERLYEMFSDILFIQHNPYILKEDTPWIVAKEPMKQEQLDYIFQSWYEVIHDWKPNKLIDPPHLEWQYDLISNLPALHDKKTFSKWVPALITHIFANSLYIWKIKMRKKYIFHHCDHNMFLKRCLSQLKMKKHMIISLMYIGLNT